MTVVAIAHLLKAVQEHYQAGQFQQAAHLCRQVLQQHPRQGDAHFWLGLISDQQGRLEESITHYEQVLALQPNSAEAHGNLGAVLLKVGRIGAAIAHHRQALARMPDNPNAHYNLAVALYQQGTVDEAIAEYQQAVALNPHYANAHHNLGMAFYRQNKLDEAIAHYQQAVTLTPDHANCHNSLGVALYRKGKLEEAIAHYQQAIALNPDYAVAYDNLGIALKQQGKLEDAIASYRQAIALNPTYASAFNNLGNALREQGQYEAAALACQEALRLRPDYADAHNTYGCVLVDLGNYEAAIAAYEEALHHAPNYADAHLNLGMIRLLLGDLQRGFAEYHWRWRSQQCSPLRYPQALWDGADLQGKVILLTAEQGFGDTIQFARYATLVAQRGGRVVIACQKPLIRLLATVPGVERCVDRDKDNVETHAHAPLMELPEILGTILDSIPATVPYVAPPVDSTLALDTPPNTGLKIGFVWSTSPTNSTTPRRSCSLSYFLSLLEIPGVALYSLHKEPPASDLAALESQPRLQDLRSHLQDFGDTAAAIAQLDLIITVDTAVAHLAGALGKPVWTLLPFVADWRWLRDRSDSPWYPTMRLFRQPRHGDWDSVFQQVRRSLEATLQDRQVRATPSSPRPTPQPCRHGNFLYDPRDRPIGQSLDLYGEWMEQELALFRHLLKPGQTLVEVGANIAAQTVFFAHAVGNQGKIIALEGDRLRFQTLCANLALNGITNTHTYRIHLGAEMSPPSGFTPPSKLRLDDQFTTSLDSLEFPPFHWLKIALPGQEVGIIQGSLQTLRQYCPLLYLHLAQPDVATKLLEILQPTGYTLYWHRPSLYNPANFRQRSHNLFGSTIRNNLFALHTRHSMTVNGMEPVKSGK